MTDDVAQWTAALDNPDPARRAEAAEQLARCGPRSRQAAVRLVGLAGDTDPEVQEWAVAALEDMGPPDPADLEALISLLGTGSGDVAYWAATLIGRMQHVAAAAVPALTSALEHAAEPVVRQRAAWALGQIGPAASGAKAALERAAGDASPRLAQLARRSIEQICR